MRSAMTRMMVSVGPPAFRPFVVPLALLLVVLSPHLGILLLSLSKVWSYSVVPDVYTLDNYATVFRDSTGMMANTLLTSPSSKAGAYAIQGLASKFIEKIEGCYFNVVGLPVALVYRHLRGAR